MAPWKFLTLGASSLLSIVFAGAMPPPDDEPPPPHSKKKEAGGPAGELTKTYTLLRRLQADSRTTGRPEERLSDWMNRAAKLYRKAVEAAGDGEDRKAREYSIAAHDIARAIDHARNASTTAPDDELPPPPGARDDDDRARDDLKHAHDRIMDLRDDDDAPDSAFYFKAAKDLYNAARRDAEAGRIERAGELARAAEALTHVPEHLERATTDRPEPKEKKEKKDRPGPKEKKERKEKKDRPDFKEKRGRPEPGDRIPPPID
jgi:hypothetical protein